MKKTINFLASPHFLKFCIISSVALWTSTIVVGLLMAQFDQSGPGYDPTGFNPAINFISDLGSPLYTPLPTILTFGMMGTGLLLIPFSFAVRTLLLSDGTKLWRKILSNITFGILLIGIVGFFLTGVLSEETGDLIDQTVGFPFDSYPWHRLVADISLGSFMICGMMVSIQLVIFKDILEKEIALPNPRVARVLLIFDTVILGPVFFGLFHNAPYYKATDTAFWTFLPIWKWKALWEWLLMFSAVGFLFSISLMLIKPLNRVIIRDIVKS
jgi:hypothetical protein